MPTAALRPCRTYRCGALVERGYCDAHKRDDDRRPNAGERGYGWRWQQRRKHYLQLNPLCVGCAKVGRTTAADVVDHIVPHRGDAKLFWDSQSNWQSLCFACHNSEKQRLERAG